MPRMIDGQDTNAAATCFEFPPTALLSEVFQDQNLDQDQLVLCTEIIKACHTDFSFFHRRFEKARLAPANWSVGLRFNATNRFSASACALRGLPNQYQIEIAYAVPVILLSIAAMMEKLGSAHLNQAPIDILKDPCSTWLQHVSSTNRPSQHAIDDTRDAMLLLYFHELAHVVFGHCDFLTDDSDQIRALELDADFQSGSMFLLWVGDGERWERCANNAEDRVSRLIRGGALLNIALKRYSARSLEYHFPTNRMQAVLAGGAYAGEKRRFNPNFSSELSGNDYWFSRLNDELESFNDLLRRSPLSSLVGVEQDVEADSKLMFDTTCPALDRLQKGPLKTLGVC
jgi:hypothetical protein